VSISLFSLSSGAAEPDAASRPFADATQSFRDGDYAHALEQFLAAESEGMDDAAVHYNVAVCYYKLGRFPEAEAEFRIIARRFAGLRALAEYNLGRSLARQDRVGEARAAFERARRGGDQKIAQLAEAALARTQPAPAAAPTARWSGLIDLTGGRDDNVALLEESGLAAGASADSALAEVFAYAARAPTSGRGVGVDVSVYAVKYADASEFDQNAVRVAVHHPWRLGQWRTEVGAQLDYSTLGGSGFETQAGLVLRLRRALSERTDLLLRATHEAITDASSRYAFVSGSRDRLRIGIERAWSAKRLSAYYELERNDRDAATVSPRRNAFSIRYRQPLSDLWSLDLRMWARESRYEELQPTRDESLRQLVARLTRELPSGWWLSGEYLHAVNDSNVDLYGYRRNRVTVGVTKTF
jgi:tetratricopeptide (TPR) repeat protein